MTVHDLAEWVAEEQATLWHDLDDALRGAINGVWSIEAGGIAGRIISAARLVGPTPTDSLPYRFVAGGVYEAILAAGGIAAPMPDAAEFDRLDAMMEKHGATRERSTAQLAATVAAIKRDTPDFVDA